MREKESLQNVHDSTIKSPYPDKTISKKYARVRAKNRGAREDSLQILGSVEPLSKKPPLQNQRFKWWEHVTKANELMVKNSPAAADKEMLEKIAAANVGPGMEFDTSVLTGDVTENWKTMLTEIRIKIIKEGQKFSKKLGQWDYFGEPIGDFNTEYAYRALVALAGLGANTVEVALYPKIEQDADGNTLLNFL